VAEHVFRLLGDIIFRIEVHRKAGLITPEKVPNGHAHSIPGCLFFAPLIDPEFLILQRLQQIDSNLCKIHNPLNGFMTGKVIVEKEPICF